MKPIPNPITQTITEFEILSFTEQGAPFASVVAVVRTNVGTRQLVLWSGDEIAGIGQYTDADIEARVVQLLSES